MAFAHDLPEEMRSDRVIATAWDATFTLFDGNPSAAEIERLERNVPLQEAGRISAKELSLSRANRSVRLFEYVVKELAQGRQPERSRLEQTGYLMRTTAVYGAGKFGAADRSTLVGRPEMQAPFQAEMLSVWLTRAFTIDLVDHLAAEQGGNSAYSEAGKINIIQGIKVIGVKSLMNSLPLTASSLYAKNLFSFIRNLYSREKKDFYINLEDEIITKSLIGKV